MDIVAPSQGKTVPSSRIKKIQAPEQAVVEEILVTEGQKVAKGQPLVHLDRARIEAERDYLKERLATARANAARLRALSRAGHTPPQERFEAPSGLEPDLIDSTRRLMRQQWRAYRSELDALKEKRANRLAVVETITARLKGTRKLQPFMQRQVDRLERLTKKQVAPVAELEEAKQEWVKGHNEVGALKKELAEARTKAKLIEARIRAKKEAFRSTKQKKLAQAERRIATLGQKLAKVKARLERHTLRAPITGTVNDLAIHTQGGVVKPAQTLMRVVPEKSPLEVRAKVRNRDIGFVQPGQRVDVKVAAFKFTKYGSIPGTITELSRSSTPDKKMGSVYYAQVKLDRSYMTIEGKRVKLLPGMQVTVDVNLGKRRVIEYITSPILRYQDEALRER
jgi:hemolysin D